MALKKKRERLLRKKPLHKPQKGWEQPQVPRPSFSDTNPRSLRCPSDSRPLNHSAILGRTRAEVHQSNYCFNNLYTSLSSTMFQDFYSQ